MLVIFATHPIQYQVPLWKKLTEAGINLEVWYFTDFGVEKSYDAEFGKKFSWDIDSLDGYKYRFLQVNKFANPNNGFRGIILKENLLHLFKKHKVTHTYINGWQVQAYWQALWQSKKAGLITILKGESNDIKPEISWKFPFKKYLLNLFFNKIDYFLYIGSANRRLYKRYGIDDKKLLPGLYCVDNKRFNDNSLKLSKNRSFVKKKWNIPDNKFCILFSGKFIQKKRPLDIINAVATIPHHQQKIHVIFVGSGELANEIKTASNLCYDEGKLHFPNKTNDKVNISIIGFLNQTEIYEAYAVADVLILPSDYNETWGLVVNEAMASNVPCISSNQCGSTEDLVRKLDENLVYPCGDILKLAKAIEYMMKQPINIKKKLDIINEYTYESTITSIHKIINKK